MERPQYIKLQYPSFLNPFVFNKLRNEGIKGVVSNENGVSVEGEFFKSDTPLVS